MSLATPNSKLSETTTSPNGLMLSTPSTIPLRIAKTRRDAVQTQLARRQSSSYNHVRQNNLVTNSPFKRFSKIPTPRKVSGETRRVDGENEEPEPSPAFKRKQSRGFEGLQKEQPVSKSPFVNKRLPATPSRLTATPPKSSHRESTPSPKSSLVSKRLRGPRSPSSSPSSTPGRRNRRKTVTFDERCDVVEFEAESEHSQDLEDLSRDIGNDAHDLDDPNALIDSILQDTLLNANPDDSLISLDSSVPSILTPPMSPRQLTNSDNEDGVPYGRSHHADRVREAHANGSSKMLHRALDQDDSPRAYHGQRLHRHEEVDEELELLSSSPSPARAFRNTAYPDGLIPKLDLPVMENPNSSFFDIEEDPFIVKPRHSSSPPPGARSSRFSRDDDKQVKEGDHCLGSEIEDSPLLHASEIDNMDGKITPVSEESGGTSGQDNSESFVSAISEPSENRPVVTGTVDQNTESPLRNNLPGRNDSVKIEFQQPLSQELPRKERPESISLSFDFGQPGVELGDMRSALDRLVMGAREMTMGESPTSLEIADAHDRSGFSGDGSFDNSRSEGISHARFDDSIATETEEGGEMIFPEPPTHSTSFRNSRSFDVDVPPAVPTKDNAAAAAEERAATPTQQRVKYMSPELPVLPPVSFDRDIQLGSSTSSTERATIRTPPSVVDRPVSQSTPVSPHSAIAERQALIAQRRREQREAELELERQREWENAQIERERRMKWEQQQQVAKQGEGRRSFRRSMSTGDAEDIMSSQASGDLLSVSIDESSDNIWNVSFGNEEAESPLPELKRKIEAFQDRKYHLRERTGVIYASADDKISHMGSVGDVDHGRAWKTVRRPSDMNEYSRQIKEWRTQEKPGKAYGKVFVRVCAIKLGNVPMPASNTVFTCTLNNGIHFVTTPECKLAKESRIDQEFELIEHSKLEFTLTLKARRDPHIIALMRSLQVPLPPEPSPPPVASKSRRLGFFSSSPKKTKLPPAPRPATSPPTTQTETFGRYLKSDGTFARVFVPFKEIASRCDTRLFETSFPLVCQKSLAAGETTVNIGEMILQIFRLPPLPGIPTEQLPQSLDECIRGLRHINWHKVTYHEGTLTQNGGDCSTWRRRRLRVIGASLVAFNDVTKKPIATIDLRKAIGVEDDQDNSQRKRGRVYSDEFDALYGVERSFKLLFSRQESISFFADNDEEKAKWLEVLRALVGHIPPNPLWAELLWQRYEESIKAGPSNTKPPTLPGKIS